MKERDYDVKIVNEGAATKLMPKISQHGAMFRDLPAKVKGLGVIAGGSRPVCQDGCPGRDKEEGIYLLDDISGHPSMARYQADGYEVISF